MAEQTSEYRFEHAGFCELCEKPTIFTADHPYFRNSLRCPQCRTIPRHRAIWHCLNLFAPKWRQLTIHEGSPGPDRVSQRLTTECTNYIASQYNTNISLGVIVEAPMMLAKKYHNENLESQTFADDSFDIVFMQDVFEHIFNPELAIKEIARTLRPGGLLIMTVPIVKRTLPSQRRAALLPTGEIVHMLEPQYHGNPVSARGALVTIDWGYDISGFLQKHSNLSIVIMRIDNIDIGVRAALCDVVVGVKQSIYDL